MNAIRQTHPTRRQILRIGGAITGGAAMTAALGGCSSFVGGGEENDPATLRGYLSPAQRDGLKDVVPRFEKAEDVKFEASYANAEEINQQLRVHLTSGTAADVFRVSPGYSSPVAALILGGDGNLADLSDEPWAAQVPDAARQLSELDGKLMAFPTSTQAIANVYNRNVFDKVGVEPPQTWPELLDVCEKIKAAGTTPIAIGLAEGIAIQFTVYALAACLVYTAQPDIDERMQSGAVTFASSPEWKEALERFRRLSTEGFTTPGALGVSGEQASQAVATGDAAMVTSVAVGVPQLAEFAPGGIDDLGVFAMPGADRADETTVPIAPEFIGINADAKDADVAKSFLEFLAKPESVASYVDASSALPGIDAPDVKVNPVLEPVMPYIRDGRTVGFANYLWPNAEIQQTLLQAGQQYWAAEITVDALLKKMDEALAKGQS